VLLLNRHARGWLLACTLVAAAVLTRVVPWPVGLVVLAPLAVPAFRRRLADPGAPSLTDRQLAHAWSTSTLATRAWMTVPDRVALTAYRQTLLDEIARRS
jgi:hypothetical protein